MSCDIVVETVNGILWQCKNLDSEWSWLIFRWQQAFTGYDARRLYLYHCRYRLGFYFL